MPADLWASAFSAGSTKLLIDHSALEQDPKRALNQSLGMADVVRPEAG